MGHRTYRSKAYLSYVHTLPSTVDGSSTDVVAHHVRLKAQAGMGQKPSDYWCLPLTAEQHMRLHQQGEASFWEQHGIDPHAQIAMNLMVYLAQQVHARRNFVQDVRLIEDFVEALARKPIDDF